MSLLTQLEAENLLNLLKQIYETVIVVPELGEREQLEAISKCETEKFNIHIRRGTRNPEKIDIYARTKRQNLPILELHMNPYNNHTNPDGEKIEGSHWHIYTEEYGRDQAHLFTDLSNPSNIDAIYAFFIKFNIIDREKISVIQQVKNYSV